jgi:hypothetical protein
MHPGGLNVPNGGGASAVASPDGLSAPAPKPLSRASSTSSKSSSAKSGQSPRMMATPTTSLCPRLLRSLLPRSPISQPHSQSQPQSGSGLAAGSAFRNGRLLRAPRPNLEWQLTWDHTRCTISSSRKNGVHAATGQSNQAHLCHLLCGFLFELISSFFLQ